ncbi:phosphotransferase [Pseudactinotalea sp.]|uniref:phosphotransferase n=1 Tax=Pseudactinotalea sp. TaxID=1926260 RepID=UPI003B3A6C8A
MTAPARHAAPARVGEDGDLALLTGPEAPEIVRAALLGSEPADMDLQVRVLAVHHRPGAGVSVCYDVTHAGAPLGEVLVASTSEPTRHDHTDGVAVLDDGARSLRVWRRADDPALPGLRGALDPAQVGAWLGRGERPALSVLSYRPTRRAVVAAHVGEDTFYLKVVRPRRASDLVQRHHVLQGSGLGAPAVLAEPEPGVLVLAPARGRSLAQALAAGEPGLLPAPESVLAALDSMPAEVAELPLRPSWVDRLDFHAAAARSALPARASEVDGVARRVSAVLAAEAVASAVPTHGDLNVANLFVDGGRVAGVIDVDSLGPGRRADDLATLLAHLLVLPALAPQTYALVPEVTARWREAFAAVTDPRELEARTAAVLISLVAGASADQAHARLDLALAAVGRADHGGVA